MCVSIFSNIFSSETIGLIEAKFHVEPPWDGVTKVCSNALGQVTKSSPEPSKLHEALSTKGQGHSFALFQITQIKYF